MAKSKGREAETTEDRALRLLNGYRKIFGNLYGEDVLLKSDFWYEHGYFYLWPAQRMADGTAARVADRPAVLRGFQLENMTEALQRRKKIDDEVAPV